MCYGLIGTLSFLYAAWMLKCWIDSHEHDIDNQFRYCSLGKLLK